MQRQADQRAEHQRKRRFWLRELIVTVLSVTTIAAAAYCCSMIGLCVAVSFWIFALPIFNHHFNRRGNS